MSIGVVGNCLIGLLIGFALQPARVASFPVAVTRHVKTHDDPSLVSVIAGRVSGEPNASQSQWSETASEGAALLFNLVVGFAVEVCTQVTLCCAQRGGSQEIIVAVEQT